jgi:hypothetical protein
MIVQRNPEHFLPDPLEFIPQRWITEEELKVAKEWGQELKHTTRRRTCHSTLVRGSFSTWISTSAYEHSHIDIIAYLPHVIALGAYLGRMLSMHEMHMGLAASVRHFDIQFMIGFEPQRG